MSEGSAAKEVKDWHSSKYIWKRARYLLEHPDEAIPSDVTFLVGDGLNEPQKVFRCHKFILAMVSAMFQAMFYGTFPQTEVIINVPDVTPTAFQHMLRYAYGENVELDGVCMEDALDTLYCAKRYLIAKLTHACRDHIQLLVTVLKKDPCIVLQRAPHMDEEDLATLALARIAQYTSDVIEGDSFPSLSFDCLKRIVDYPLLNVTEANIYQGVRRWVERNVGLVTGNALRDAFGSLLYSIRFPLLSATELADGPVTDGVLTGDEASSIFQYILAQLKPALPFLTVPRTPMAPRLLYQFDLLTTPHTAKLGGFVRNLAVLYVRPDLAPECCALLRQLVESKLHIRIASFDNEHVGKTVRLPEFILGVILEERNVLAHSIKSACWFEWDTEAEGARNIRIGVGKKPEYNHTAVFGFVLGPIKKEWVPFDLWDDRRLTGIANFRLY